MQDRDMRQTKYALKLISLKKETLKKREKEEEKTQSIKKQVAKLMPSKDEIEGKFKKLIEEILEKLVNKSVELVKEVMLDIENAIKGGEKTLIFSSSSRFNSEVTYRDGIGNRKVTSPLVDNVFSELKLILEKESALVEVKSKEDREYAILEKENFLRDFLEKISDKYFKNTLRKLESKLNRAVKLNPDSENRENSLQTFSVSNLADSIYNEVSPLISTVNSELSFILIAVELSGVDFLNIELEYSLDTYYGSNDMGTSSHDRIVSKLIITFQEDN